MESTDKSSSELLRMQLLTMPFQVTQLQINFVTLATLEPWSLPTSLNRIVISLANYLPNPLLQAGLPDMPVLVGFVREGLVAVLTLM